MELLLDSGNPQEIEDVKATGLLSGVTTNPKIYGKLGTDFKKRLQDIIEVSPGYVFTQVVGCENVDEMVGQARWLADQSKDIVVKFPMCVEGLQAAQKAKKENPKMTVAITTVSSIAQALLSAKAGADIIALFNGALDTVSDSPVHIVTPVKQILKNYNFDCKVLSCARFARGVGEFAAAGSDMCTLGKEFFFALYEHPYTYLRLSGFKEDWGGAFGDKIWPMK